jgi:hypothetical protein
MPVPPVRRTLAPLLAGALCLASACAYTNVEKDNDEQPVVHTGVGATILYPNQTGPSMPTAPWPGNYPAGTYPGARPGASSPTRSGAQPGAPGAAAPGSASRGGVTTSTSSGSPGSGSYSGTSSGTGAPSAGNITYIGGSEIDDTSNEKLYQQPLMLRYLLAPLGVIAYPFKKIYDVVTPEPTDDIKAPVPQDPVRPPLATDAGGAWEEQQLQALDRELGQQPGAVAPAPQQAAPPQAPAPTPGASRRVSIAEELAALRAGARPGAPTAVPAPPAPAGAAPVGQGVADRVVDRDRDGRPDHWEFREGGRLVREAFDDDGSGVPDRVVHYDPSSGQKLRSEEDGDFDGRIDTWVEYQGGEVLRRRADRSGDGQPDLWDLYEGGKLARQERDENGDGFRDTVVRYQGGKLAREEKDANGDGRPDVVVLYDAAERVLQRDEDQNGDGLVDVRSHYEGGKLARRELLDAASVPIEERSLVSATWESGESAPAPAPSDRR